VIFGEISFNSLHANQQRGSHKHITMSNPSDPLKLCDNCLREKNVNYEYLKVNHIHLDLSSLLYNIQPCFLTSPVCAKSLQLVCQP
jgi:hypothetical protein